LSERPASPDLARALWGFVEAFVVGGALVALWMMPQWLWTGDVKVVGCDRLSPAFVERTAGLPAHATLYRVDPEAIRRRLMAVSAIENVRIRRWLFPPRLEIAIRERMPRAAVLGTGGYLDAWGESFTLPGSPVTPPVTALLGSASLSPESRLALRTLLGSWPRGSRGTLDLRDPASWSVTMDGVTLGLGSPTDLSRKLSVYAHLQPLARQSGKTLQYVDLRFPEAPTIRTSEATR
jgi:cell division septal protein FtsQ